MEATDSIWKPTVDDVNMIWFVLYCIVLFSFKSKKAQKKTNTLH